MIARQMQPGLEQLFKEFGKAFEKPLPPQPPASASDDARQSHDPNLFVMSTAQSALRTEPNGHSLTPHAHPEDEEATMIRELESMVARAIDLFQLVDKHQLSLVGATTTVTGPEVERLIERYVLEQVHQSVVFPRLCAMKRADDQELEAKIRQMENIDISQVGIPVPENIRGRNELRLRLERAVQEFRKLGVADSPHEMMEILLAVEKTAATVSAGDEDANMTEKKGDLQLDSEKPPSSALAINADALVSLLLLVVIRAQVRHLYARLAYMYGFIFIDNVETGEMGYALSTLEAVLSYLRRKSGGLRAASRRNKMLWDATRSGRVNEMKCMLETQPDSPDLAAMNGSPPGYEPSLDAELARLGPSRLHDSLPSTPNENHTESLLGHVFPFYNVDPVANAPVPLRCKRVSMDMQSMSSSSGWSLHSRTLTIDSRASGIEGDTSADRLSRIQDPSGESVIMMAIEHRQPEALRYLLSLREHYPVDFVLGDTNNEGTTLLSAAVQTGDCSLIDVMLDFVLGVRHDQTIAAYFAAQDVRGRTMAHYLFNAHHLINRLGRLLPWRTKDKNGQTPLFALCRSYDHPNYREMVTSGLFAAKEAQRDQLPLHLDEHVDSKGNTLLHIVNDTELVEHLLLECDSDVNAINDKRFTPLMVASKYGRIDLVSVLLGDPRVDLYVRDMRGLTAVELAKDDEVRNQIDDFILLSIPSDVEGRIAGVVRSFFIEDAGVRLVVKSAVPSSSKRTLTVTTSRRSPADFEHLAKCLATEHPVSWLPSAAEGLRSAFQIPSRPSRAVLRDIQMRLNSFVSVLLAHPTFATHELLWEFFLLPEIAPGMMLERSERKAAVRVERVREDYYAPTMADDVRGIESFAQHARDEMRSVQQATKALVRCVNKLKIVECGMCPLLSFAWDVFANGPQSD
jgi:hypothetical protein